MNTICPKCKSEKISKNGKRKTENRGLIQTYKCKECSYRFVIDDGFYRMRNAPEKITLCLDLFYKGISTRQIQAHLNAFYPHNSSWVSIYKWVVKYADKITKFTESLKLKVGKEIQIDEIEIGKRESQYHGWFIDSIDTDTRFMVSTGFKRNRQLEEVKEVLQNIKDKTENQVEKITSDGWLAYPNAIQKVYGFSNKTHKLNIIHNKVTQLKHEGFNHKIERMHNSIRQRTKTNRGFHGSIESFNSLMNGYKIYYNFIRKHMALGKTPSELATDIKLNENNKWLELINISAISSIN